MGTSVLDPNNYVPDPSDDQPLSSRWNGQGPMLAADGKIGALQSALSASTSPASGGQQTYPYSSSGGLSMAARPVRPFDDNSAQDFAQTLQGRIRSPDQLNSAAAERRGALEQLMKANSGPDNTLPWTQNYLHGVASAPYFASGDMATSFGIKDASDNLVNSNVQTNQKNVQNALAKLKFLQGEDKSASDSEDKALTAGARVLATQARGATGAGALAAQLGIIKTKDGLYQAGEDGVHLIVPAGQNYTHLVEMATRSADQMMNSPQFQFSGTAEERLALRSKIIDDNLAKMAMAVRSVNGGGQNPAGAELPAVPGQSAPAAAPAAAPGAFNNDLLHQAQIQMESGGNPNAVSKKGAIGVGQIMPDTGPEAAALAGVQWDPQKFKTDPAYQMQLSRAYQDEQTKKFGNPIFGLAAYNMGPTAFQNWLKSGGEVSKLPAETRDYVGKVMLKYSLMNQQGQGQAATPEQAAAAPAAQPVSAPATPAAAPAAPAKSVLPVDGQLPDIDMSIFGQGPQQKPGAQFLTKSQLTRGTENEKVLAKNNENLMKEWTNMGVAGQEEEQQLSTVRSLLQNGYTPGADALARQKLGNWLAAAGMDNKLTDHAMQSGEIQSILQRVVNDRARKENGVLTNEDISRFAATYPKITDQKEAAQFTLDHITELAQRNQLRAQLAGQILRSDPNLDLQTAWKKYSQNVLGPAVVMINGNPITRNRYIADTVAANPNADPNEARQWAAQHWLMRAAQQTKRTGR